MSKWMIDKDDPTSGVMLRGRVMHEDCKDPTWLCDEVLIHESYEGKGWERFRKVYARVLCQGCNLTAYVHLQEWAPEVRQNGSR